MLPLRRAKAALCVMVPLGLSLSAGCSDDSPAVARAFLTSVVIPGKDGAAVCQVHEASWVNIGSVNAPVEDGKSQTGAGVGVTCRVVATGDGFDVFASAVLSGVGSVTISGKFTSAGADKSVRAVFQRGDVGGKFEENDCTVTYDAGMGIAAGRVWGRLDCPKIQDLTTSFGSPPQPRTCAGSAEFRFENCAR